MPRDYYEVLGVPRTATVEEIKRAYRKLARQHHPDRNPGDKQAETRFKEIQAAYDTLSDKKKRERYDQFGFADPGDFAGGAGQHPFGGSGGPIDIEDLLRQFGGGGGGAGGMPEGFEVFFGNGPRQTRSRSRRARAAEAVEAEVEVPFLTAALGGTVTFSNGENFIELTVPPGAEDGKRMRLQGQAPGGADLIARLRIQPHPYFKREGNDIVLEVPLSITEAALGTKVDVPTIRGEKLSVTIKPGTSSGARRRLPGFGIAGGDQYIEIKIVTPTKLDSRSRELLQELARLNPQDPRAGLSWA